MTNKKDLDPITQKLNPKLYFTISPWIHPWRT